MRRKNTTTDMMKTYMAQSLFLLMQKSPYDEISIGEITKRAGVNRSTYYRNFTSKDDIIHFYLNRMMEEYTSAYILQEKRSLRDYLQTLFEHFYAHKNALLLLYQNKLSHLLLNTFNDWFSHLEKTENVSMREHYRIAYHVGGIYNHLMLWFSRGMQETPLEMVQISLSILPAGFQPFLL